MKKTSELLVRYKGVGGHAAIVEALGKQALLNGCSDAIHKLSRLGRPLSFFPGDCLMKEGDTSRDIFFVFCGQVAALKSNREFARRGAGQAVGELALIDRAACRSATIVAVEETVAFRVKEADFSKTASRASKLWRNLAIDCARKLRERLQSIRAKNPEPVVFIGSSKESLRIAEAIEKILLPVAKVNLWSKGVFTNDELVLESLERQTREVDFAVLVFAPDDHVVCRTKKSPSPRDNVVLELGMFLGALGHKRAFVIKPRNCELKIPTDLLGKNHINYTPRKGKALQAELLEACQPLLSSIRKNGAI